ncbi:MAG: PD-(D/E)XK nuclease family protein [Candidatus Liptonbacteria bacterium]|nr:PD-(D/E)XK nuclease family protein [Candidatus Liptonbacteria bacterium]
MNHYLRQIVGKLGHFYLTIRRGKAKISESREVAAGESREVAAPSQDCPDAVEIVSRTALSQFETRVAEICPYCKSSEFIKRGTRKKKFETVQLYECKKTDCGRTFTAQFVRGRHFPLVVIIEGLNYYNLGFGLEETCRLLSRKFKLDPGAATLADWVSEYSDLCRYVRLRPFAIKMCKPRDTVEVVTLAHRQLYRFRYHRPKLKLMLEEYKHHRFTSLKEYLDGVASETPHQYFQEGLRISEVRSKFDKAQMIIRGKTNYANRLAEFVLPVVADNKDRHEQLQRFFIANDSVTVATEVPVYIRREDIEHMENQLKFKILPRGEDNDEWYLEVKRVKEKLKGIPALLTGHIDFVQVRNGQIHLLDYKPNAAKEKPIEQLTWYALALSRLTGLRLFEFKCAWFDEKDYFEFYPLHVVHKLSEKKRAKRVKLKSGALVSIPRKNVLQVV